LSDNASKRLFTLKEEKEGRKMTAKSFLKKFGTFLMYGGWMVIAVGVLAVMVLTSTK